MIHILSSSENDIHTKLLNKATVTNLNLREVVRTFCTSETECDFVLKIVSRLEQNADAIRGRQDVIKDFMLMPEFLYDCKKVLQELDSIIGGSDILKRHTFYPLTIYESDQRKKTRTVFGNISDIAKVLLRLIRMYVNMDDILNKYQFKSEKMRMLQSYFHRFRTSSGFEEYGQFVNQLSHIEQGTSNICINVFIDKEIGGIYPTFFSINGSESIWQKSFVNYRDKDMVTRLTGVAVEELCIYLSDIIDTMKQQLSILRKETMFFTFALRYIEVLNNKSLPITWPYIMENKSIIEFENLYGINLIAKGIFKVVPNNIKTGALTVIYGDNNTGKTCYLCCMALAQIFAQAGLPVPAISSKVFPVSNIFSQFASKEKDLGRFEEEVKEISNIFDMVDDRALILLNETFQSTAYEEIASPYMDILDTMTALGAYVYVVSHNKILVDMCKKNVNVQVLEMNIKY